MRAAMQEYGWIAIASSDEVRVGQVVSLRRLGRQWALWRTRRGDAQMVEDRCPHRGARLSLGKVLDDGCLECPFHGFRFDGAGRCTHIPALPDDEQIPAALHRRPVALRESHGLLFLWGDDSCAPDGEPPWFPHLEGRWSITQHVEEWRAHHTRVMENQLDHVHLPFVHRRTIGRLVKSYEPRSLATQEGGFVWEGAAASGTSQRRRQLLWREPNLWSMPLSPLVVVLIAAVPVDDTRTRIYLRSYQRLLLAPLIGAVVSWLLMRVHRVILREDRRIVESQPEGDSLLTEERGLLDFDEPVSAYRQRRAHRIDERRQRQLAATTENRWVDVDANDPGQRRAMCSIAGAKELAEET